MGTLWCVEWLSLLALSIWFSGRYSWWRELGGDDRGELAREFVGALKTPFWRRGHSLMLKCDVGLNTVILALCFRNSYNRYVYSVELNFYAANQVQTDL